MLNTLNEFLHDTLTNKAKTTTFCPEESNCFIHLSWYTGVYNDTGLLTNSSQLESWTKNREGLDAKGNVWEWRYYIIIPVLV